jgi:hypothetical protein
MCASGKSVRASGLSVSVCVGRECLLELCVCVSVFQVSANVCLWSGRGREFVCVWQDCVLEW